VALAWLLARPFLTSVIVGASTAGQLDDNFESATVELQPDELAMLDALTASPPLYPGWMETLFPDATLERALGGEGEPAARAAPS
jgi:diketogulonate reductase-like aldo/keto reductase